MHKFAWAGVILLGALAVFLVVVAYYGVFVDSDDGTARYSVVAMVLTYGCVFLAQRCWRVAQDEDR